MPFHSERRKGARRCESVVHQVSVEDVETMRMTVPMYLNSTQAEPRPGNGILRLQLLGAEQGVSPKSAGNGSASSNARRVYRMLELR